MTSDAKRMMDLFEGFMDAHGTHGRGVANAAKGGKLEIKTTARTINEPVTEKLWEQHLSGKMPIGIMTLRRDHTVYWGCIDVDVYDISHQEIVQRIAREKLPLLVCKTKSGGAHCYLFMKEPVSARNMIDKLNAIAAILGFGGSEIFPKQAEADFDAGANASWLNMPYLGGDKTDRYCVNEKGKGLTLRQFLDRAEAARIDPDELEELGQKKMTGHADFANGPPCMQTLSAEKFKANRNNGLVSLGAFCKKKWPDDWQKKLYEFNQTIFDPPLPEEEVKSAINGLSKKAYNYLCKQQPLVQFCNSALCRTRKFGVGGGGGPGNMPKMGNLAVLNTDEPIWFLDIEGVRVQLSSGDLLGYAGLQQKAMEMTRVVPPMLKKDTWINILSGLLAECVVIDAPEEVGVSGQFFEIVEGHLTDRQKAKEREEILLGKPWLDDKTGRIYFRLRDIQEACERVRFRSLTRTGMTSKIKEWGGEHDFFKLRGRGTNVWSLPSSILSEQTESHRTPDLEESVI